MEDIFVGKKINRYEVKDCLHKTELLGLYKVFDTKLERNVLMKLVFHSSSYSQDFIEYFLGEARSLAKLSHPNIARVLDFGYDNGNLYLISEYHSGSTIARLMGTPIPWQNAIETLLPVADALSYAHAQGIIHRDLKPENMVLTEDDRLMLSDFSLIRIIESEETRDVTGTNVGLGSPAYISPEQGKGMTVDFRSDIYSMGIIFFEMVTGRKPFTGGTSMEMVIQHVTAPPPSPRQFVADLPESIEKIMLTALSKDVDTRYQTMNEFSDALRNALSASGQAGKAPSRRLNPKFFASAASLVVLVLIAGLWVSGSFQTTSLSPTDIVDPAAKLTSSPTATLLPTSTPTPLAPTVSPTPQNQFPVAAFSLPDLPVLPGTSVPDAGSALSRNNIDSIVELARWGNPHISQFLFIEEDRVLLAATSAGVYYFDPTNLTPRYFFDTRGPVSALAVSRDGEWVATGNTTGHIHIWKVKDGSAIADFQAESGPIKSMDFSPDKSMLVSNAVGKTARIWDLNQKSQLVALEGHGLNINRVLFSPDGERVISGGDDFKIIVWDVYSGSILKKLTASKKINDLALSSDGDTVVLAMSNATIEIWDLRADTRVNLIGEPDIVEEFTFVKFLPSDQLIISGSADGKVRIWNIQGTDLLWETTYEDAANVPEGLVPIASLAVSQDGAKFITLFEDDRAEIWNLTDQKRLLTSSLNHKPVKQVSLSPDGNMLAYQGGESLVSIWSFAKARQTAQVDATLPRGHPFSEDSKALLLQSSSTLDLYSITQSEPQLLFSLLEIPRHATVNFLRDDTMVAAGDGGTLRYWSMSSGMELRPGRMENSGSCRIIFSREGEFLAASSSNGLIATDQNLGHFCQVSRGPRTISEDYLSDGSILALSQENQAVEVWSVQSGGQGTSIRSEVPGDILGVAISRDGTLLAAASESGVVEIYDLGNMEHIGSLELYTGPVNHVLFSHDNKYIITGSDDGIVRFFGLRP
jgi:eukaryotic-like serine/threonine-protein kinase